MVEYAGEGYDEVAEAGVCNHYRMARLPRVNPSAPFFIFFLNCRDTGTSPDGTTPTHSGDKKAFGISRMNRSMVWIC